MTAAATALSSDQMAREVALDLSEGSFVNLGIGLPQRVAAHVPYGREVVFHAENGVVGAGAPAQPGAQDPDLIDAGKVPITLVPGGCFISHTDSFALVRGGHLDICVMGALQVSASGDLANWSAGDAVPGVGGAMDLAKGAKRVFVLMRHTQRDGAPKLLDECTLPLTGRRVVSRVYTELGIFEPAGRSWRAVALVTEVSLDDVQALTGAPLEAPNQPERLPR